MTDTSIDKSSETEQREGMWQLFVRGVRDNTVTIDVHEVGELLEHTR